MRLVVFFLWVAKRVGECCPEVFLNPILVADKLMFTINCTYHLHTWNLFVLGFGVWTLQKKAHPPFKTGSFGFQVYVYIFFYAAYVMIDCDRWYWMIITSPWPSSHSYMVLFVYWPLGFSRAQLNPQEWMGRYSSSHNHFEVEQFDVFTFEFSWKFGGKVQVNHGRMGIPWCMWRVVQIFS